MGNELKIKEVGASWSARREWARDLQDARMKLAHYVEHSDKHARPPRFGRMSLEKLERVQKEIYDLSEGQDS